MRLFVLCGLLACLSLAAAQAPPEVPTGAGPADVVTSEEATPLPPVVTDQSKPEINEVIEVDTTSAESPPEDALEPTEGDQDEEIDDDEELGREDMCSAGKRRKQLKKFVKKNKKIFKKTAKLSKKSAKLAKKGAKLGKRSAFPNPRQGRPNGPRQGRPDGPRQGRADGPRQGRADGPRQGRPQGRQALFTLLQQHRPGQEMDVGQRTRDRSGMQAQSSQDRQGSPAMSHGKTLSISSIMNL